MILLLDGEPSFSLESLKQGEIPDEFIWNGNIGKLESKILPPHFPQKLKEGATFINDEIKKIIYVVPGDRIYRHKRFFISTKGMRYEFLLFSFQEENNIQEEIEGQTIHFTSWSLNEVICKIVLKHSGEVEGRCSEMLLSIGHIKNVNLFIKLFRSFNYFRDYFGKPDFDFIKYYCDNNIVYQNSMDALINDFTKSTLNQNLTLLVWKEEEFLKILINSIADHIGEEPLTYDLNLEKLSPLKIKEFKKAKYIVIYNVESTSDNLNKLMRELAKLPSRQTRIFVSNQKYFSSRLGSLFSTTIVIPTFNELVKKEGITKIFYACLSYLFFHHKKEKPLFHGNNMIIDKNEFATLIGKINNFQSFIRILENFVIMYSEVPNSKTLETKFEPHFVNPQSLLLTSVDFWYQFSFLKLSIMKDKKLEGTIDKNQVSGVSNGTIEVTNKPEGVKKQKEYIKFENKKGTKWWKIISNLSLIDTKLVSYNSSKGIKAMAYLVKHTSNTEPISSEELVAILNKWSGKNERKKYKTTLKQLITMYIRKDLYKISPKITHLIRDFVINEDCYYAQVSDIELTFDEDDMIPK